MRGLTVEEFEQLQWLSTVGQRPPRIVCDGSPRFALNHDLVEQGRAQVGPPRLATNSYGICITPAGREALRLWPLLRERMEVKP